MTLWKLLAALCLWCAPVLSHGAVGTSGVEAWYVRPPSVCPINGDGLGYDCAPSAGAHGAFSGLASVQWSPMSGVDDGDTLYVCGAHSTMLNTSASGSSGNRLVISGDCPGDRGSISTVGGTPVDSGIQLINSSYVEIRGFAAITGNRTAVLLYASNVVMVGNVVTRNVIDNRLSASSTNFCNGVGLDGPFGHAQFTATYNTILGTATACGGTSNSDGINLINLISGLIAWNDISGAEGGIDLDGTMEGVDVYANWLHDNRVDGLKAFGGHACPIGPLRVHNNLIINNGNWGAIWQNQRNGTFANNTILQFRSTPQSGSAPYGGLQTEDPPLNNGASCVGEQNVFFGNLISANWQYGVATHYSVTRQQFETRNKWSHNLLHQNGGQVPLVWFGTPLAPTSTVTASDYTAWSAAHVGDQFASPQFRDAAACTGTETVVACQQADFRLSPESPFQTDGPWWGRECVGVHGVVCAPPVVVRGTAVEPTQTYTFTGTITGPAIRPQQ